MPYNELIIHSITAKLFSLFFLYNDTQESQWTGLILVKNNEALLTDISNGFNTSVCNKCFQMVSALY